MSAVIDAWQAALAAEQQAAFGYALLGPRLPDARQTLARDCQSAHEALRDQTALSISAAGSTPAAPRGDYPALYRAAGKPEKLAATLEDDCAAAWRYCYSQAAGSTPTRTTTSSSATATLTPARTTAIREQAQHGLIASAVRATKWRLLTSSAHPVVAFPGSG